MSYNAYDVEGKEIEAIPAIQHQWFLDKFEDGFDGKVTLRRRITRRFATTTDGDIVKISNGEILPADEPFFLLRARDKLAIPLLLHYIELIKQQGYDNSYILELGDENLQLFRQFELDNPKLMKLPGITKGK